jgi:hypothetical protein
VKRSKGVCIGSYSALLAIDPGLDTGISWSLVRTYLAHTVHEVAALAHSFRIENPPHRQCVALIEVPRVYPERRDSDPNDLITLAIRVGAYVHALMPMGIVCLGVEPKKWKGQLPKAAHHARLQRDYPAITQAVATNVEAESKRHNAYDAFGLLMWGHMNRGLLLRDLSKDL